MSDQGDDAMQTSSTKSLSGKDDSATKAFDTIKPLGGAAQYDVKRTQHQCSNVANSSSAATSRQSDTTSLHQTHEHGTGRRKKRGKLACRRRIFHWTQESDKPSLEVEVLYFENDAESHNFVEKEFTGAVQRRSEAPEKATLLSPETMLSDQSADSSGLKDFTWNQKEAPGGILLTSISDSSGTCDRKSQRSYAVLVISWKNLDRLSDLTKCVKWKAENKMIVVVDVQTKKCITRNDLRPLLWSAASTYQWMVYPAGDDDRAEFWKILTCLLENPGMDRRHKNVRNRFGLVRHAVFTPSDDTQQGLHVVYDMESTDFVLTQLSQELERRGGLRLVPPSTGTSVVSDEQRDILDTLERCHQTLVVSTGNGFGHLLQAAMEEERQPASQPVLIDIGGEISDLSIYKHEAKALMMFTRGQPNKEKEFWDSHSILYGLSDGKPLDLDRHETDTMMIFPVNQPNREKDFWDTLSILCGLSDGKPMIGNHRHIMNSFGIVRHAVFASSDDTQQVVHVVYDWDSTDFVLTRLRMEVETRGGLRLVLPNTGTSVLSDEQRDILDRLERCRQTLVVCTTGIGRFESVMRSAVEEARHSDRQIVFIETGGWTPDPYLYRHETDTMMMFPVDQPNREKEFWDTLSIFCGFSGAQLSCCKHRSLVNSFGPVRHALLKSSHDPQHPIRLIHVMYDADSTIFVNGRLRQKLEVRAGMELVLPDTGNSTASSVKRAEFLRMLTCCQGVMVVLKVFAGRQITKTVEQNLLDVELRNPDIKMLFIENGRSICLKSEWWPQWQNPRKNRCELLTRPYDTSGVDSQEFWNKAIDFIESTTPSCSVTLEERNSTSPVPSSSVESTSQDIECTPVQIPCAASSAHSEPEDDYSVTDASAVYGASRCSSANAAEEENNSQKLPALSRISASGTKSLKLHIPMSEPETEPEKDIPSLSRLSRRSESDSDLLSLLPSRPRSLSLNNIGTTDMLHENLNLSKTGEASFDSDILNGQKLSSSAVALSEKEDPPPPIVSRRWQSVFTSSSAGGTFHKSDSDVVLDIPAHAVDGDASVDIRTAVCTDVDLVQRILKLPNDEYVSSLLVEYWAGHDFRFKKPVSIILPHFLPPDPDPHLVRVYRVARRPDGQLTVTRLKLDERRESERNPDKFVSGLDLEGSRLGQEVNKATHQEKASPEREISWEETGSFWLSTDNKVVAVTDHFSAYVCTCGQQQNDPVLIAMACGSQTREVNSRSSAQVRLYVWDKRLEIADFQQDFGVDKSQKIDKMSFHLLGFQDELPSPWFSR